MPYATNENLDSRALWDQYDRAIDEYRFQVDLNWKRAQYYFVLDVAVLVAAVGLRAGDTAPPAVVITLFAAGAAIAGAALIALGTQHTYYRATRNVKRLLEARLGLGATALTTTPGMGSRLRRIGRVHTFQLLMMWTLLLVHSVGCAIAAAQALTTEQRATVELVVALRNSAPGTIVVLSRGAGADTEVLAKRRLSRHPSVGFRLEAGNYVISAVGSEVCARSVRVGQRPAQLTTLTCR